MLQRSNRLQIIIVLTIAVVFAAAVCFLLFFPTKSHVFEYKISDNQQIKILFVGDLMFDREIRQFAAENKSNEFIFEKIQKALGQNDLVVANLEGPITSTKSMSMGANPYSNESITFTFDPSLAINLFNKNIRLVSLGNNHILNFGKDGVAQTEKYLQESGIEYFGVPQGEKSLIKEIKGIKIGFVGYNYWEFGGDLEKERMSVLEEIGKVRLLCDILVVYCHWGIEYKFAPTAEQVSTAHQFIDRGADLIIGSHPHVIQSTEEYKNKKIYYSLGNFIFDQYFSENVKRGLGVVVKIDTETKNMEFSEIDFYMQDNGQTIIK